MAHECDECAKTFSNAAGLNFHKRRVHAVGVKRKHSETSDGDNSVQTVKKKRGRPAMVKFGRIRGEIDYTKGPFKLIGSKPIQFDDQDKEVPTVGNKDVPRKRKARNIDSIETEAVSEVSHESDNALNSQSSSKVDPLMPVLTPAVPLQVRSRPGPRRSKKGKHWKCNQEQYETKATEVVGDSGNDQDVPGTNENQVEVAEVLEASVSPNQSVVPNTSSAATNDDAASYCSSQSQSSRKTHAKPALICPVCNETKFRSPHHFHVHIEIHEGKRPFLCQTPNCGMGYEDPIQLLEHVSIRHDKEKRLSCERCGNVYMSMRWLTSHKCTAS